MGNSFCKKCYSNDEDLSDHNVKYNSNNNLYYVDMVGYDSCEEEYKYKYKYKTAPGPPIIIRDKKSYIKALTLI